MMSLKQSNQAAQNAGRLPADFRDYMLAILFGGIPCLGFAAVLLGWRILLVLLAAWIPALLVSLIFSRVRKKRLKCGNVPFSLVLALLLPVSTPLWMVALASAFSILFAQEIFGGAGKQLVSPPLLAKLFLMINYLSAIQGPSFASPPAPSDSWLWIATGLAGLLPLGYLLIRYPLNRFVFAGMLAGTALMLAWMLPLSLMPQPGILPSLVTDGFAFVVCFLLLDPVTRPSQRWAGMTYGFLVSMLAFAIGIFSGQYAEGIVIALLFGNLLSPLLDVLLNQTKKEDGG